MDDETQETSPPEPTVSPSRDDALLILREHTSDTLAVAASPSNRNYLITGGMDDVGLIWDLELQRSIAKVDGSQESVSTVAFSHDGLLSAFGSENGAISVVYMDGREAPNKPLDGPGDAVHFLAWHPRGPVLLAGSADSVAYMWNAVKGSFMAAFVGHEAAVTSGGFTSDGKLLVTASADAAVRVWSPTTAATLVRIQNGMEGLRGVFHTEKILCVAMGSRETSAGSLIASGCGGGEVFVSHRESGVVVMQLPRHEGGVESVSFSADGIRPVMLASAGADGVVRVWDVEMKMERCKFEHGGVICKVVWHESLPVLASGSSNGTVALWDARGGKEVGRFEGHEGFISDLCFAGDHSFVASTSSDGTVRLFDVRPLLGQRN